MTDTIETVVAYCRENGRVCPQPMHWHALWQMLPERQRRGAGWEPPLPLILGGWNYSSNLEKMLRLQDHIEWAATHDSLPAIAAFLRRLGENDWHHLSD